MNSADFLLEKGDPRLCRSGSRSLRFTEVARGLQFRFIRQRCQENEEHRRRPDGTPEELQA